jgi:hypothetical protein
VDELLTVHNGNKTDIEDLLNCFNCLTPKRNWAIEKETGDSINFLDITIHREENNFSIDIYRKPTYTGSIIPNDSCHPTEHKYAAIRYLHNRMKNYQLSREKMDKESKITQDILHSNGYNASTLKLISSSQKQECGAEKTHWSKFTYVGRDQSHHESLKKY